jgi:hypothetical protein
MMSGLVGLRQETWAWAQNDSNNDLGSQSQQIRIQPESTSNALRGWFLSHRSESRLETELPIRQ